MRRSLLAVAGVVAAAACLALTGCVPVAVAPTPDAAPSLPASPSPSPTATPETVPPGEMPPVVFGGDCTKMLAAGDIADVMATALTAAASTAAVGMMANVGALSCGWADVAGLPVVSVTVIPAAGLDGTTFPPESMGYYFEECDVDWVCAWQGGDEAVWIAASFQGVPEMSRQRVDAWGEALGAKIAANHAAAPDEPWVRDRTGWWPTFDCTALADSVGRQLGTELVAEDAGFIDPPAPGWIMAGLASRYSSCVLRDGGGNDVVYVTTAAGIGTAPVADGWSRVDLGVPGVNAASGGRGPFGGEMFSLAVGVNEVSIEARDTSIGAPLAVATAVAAAAASDFE